MDSQDLRNLQEAYSNVYEQQIGVPLKDASDRAAKDQLKKMIPKGEKVYTPKATLQNAAYEPDSFDAILEYLVAEGYADTNDNALVIMANMSEEWRENIVEELTGERRKRAEEILSKYDRNDPRASALIKTIRDKEGSRIGTGKFPTKRGGYGKKGEMKAYSLGGGSDRGEGNKAARRAGKSVQDTRGDED